ncbi:Ba25 [Baboon cytomegalovirus]|nr:Ba25 [Baboon cytomegalovirus]
MVLTTRKWNHISYACFIFVLLWTVYNAGVLHVTCNNTKTYIGHVGGTVTLATWPLKGHGLLYWYYSPCGSTQRLCDYSGYDGKTHKSNTTKVKFTCTSNGSLLILLDVNTSYSGQYCSWSSLSSSLSSGNSRYNCHNVTVQLPPTPSPLRTPPKGTANSYTTTTPGVQLQIPSNAPYTGNNGTHNPQVQRQNATHIAGVVIVLVVIILIIILFFLKVPQKFWNKYKVTKTTAPL